MEEAGETSRAALRSASSTADAHALLGAYRTQQDQEHEEGQGKQRKKTDRTTRRPGEADGEFFFRVFDDVSDRMMSIAQRAAVAILSTVSPGGAATTAASNATADEAAKRKWRQSKEYRRLIRDVKAAPRGAFGWRGGAGDRLLVHFAAEYALDMELLRLVVLRTGSQVEEVLKLETRYGALVLHFVARNAWLGSGDLRWVVEHNPGAARVRDGSNNLPLLYMMMHNKRLIADLVSLIIEVCPEAVRLPGMLGVLPLHMAAINSHLHDAAAFRVLLDAFPDAARTANEDGLFPLQLLVRGNKSPHKDVVAMLVKAFPEACMVPNSKGRLTLHETIENNAMHAEHVVPILEAYPNAAHLPDQCGDTFLYMLVVAYLDVFSRMRQNGVPLDEAEDPNAAIVASAASQANVHTGSGSGSPSTTKLRSVHRAKAQLRRNRILREQLQRLDGLICLIARHDPQLLLDVNPSTLQMPLTMLSGTPVLNDTLAITAIPEFIEEEPISSLRVHLVSDEGTGKTTLCGALDVDDMTPGQVGEPTRGAEVKPLRIANRSSIRTSFIALFTGKREHIKVFDHGGQARFHVMHTALFSGQTGVFLILVPTWFIPRTTDESVAARASAEWEVVDAAPAGLDAAEAAGAEETDDREWQVRARAMLWRWIVLIDTVAHRNSRIMVACNMWGRRDTAQHERRVAQLQQIVDNLRHPRVLASVLGVNALTGSGVSQLKQLIHDVCFDLRQRIPMPKLSSTASAMVATMRDAEGVHVARLGELTTRLQAQFNADVQLRELHVASLMRSLQACGDVICLKASATGVMEGGGGGSGAVREDNPANLVVVNPHFFLKSVLGQLFAHSTWTTPRQPQLVLADDGDQSGAAAPDEEVTESLDWDEQVDMLAGGEPGAVAGISPYLVSAREINAWARMPRSSSSDNLPQQGAAAQQSRSQSQSQQSLKQKDVLVADVLFDGDLMVIPRLLCDLGWCIPARPDAGERCWLPLFLLKERAMRKQDLLNALIAGDGHGDHSEIWARVGRRVQCVNGSQSILLHAFMIMQSKLAAYIQTHKEKHLDDRWVMQLWKDGVTLRRRRSAVHPFEATCVLVRLTPVNRTNAVDVIVTGTLHTLRDCRVLDAATGAKSAAVPAPRETDASAVSRDTGTGSARSRASRKRHRHRRQASGASATTTGSDLSAGHRLQALANELVHEVVRATLANLPVVCPTSVECLNVDNTFVDTLASAPAPCAPVVSNDPAAECGHLVRGHLESFSAVLSSSSSASAPESGSAPAAPLPDATDLGQVVTIDDATVSSVDAVMRTTGDYFMRMLSCLHAAIQVLCKASFGDTVPSGLAELALAVRSDAQLAETVSSLLERDVIFVHELCEWLVAMEAAAAASIGDVDTRHLNAGRDYGQALVHATVAVEGAESVRTQWETLMQQYELQIEGRAPQSTDTVLPFAPTATNSVHRWWERDALDVARELLPGLQCAFSAMRAAMKTTENMATTTSAKEEMAVLLDGVLDDEAFVAHTAHAMHWERARLEKAIRYAKVICRAIENHTVSWLSDAALSSLLTLADGLVNSATNCADVQARVARLQRQARIVRSRVARRHDCLLPRLKLRIALRRVCDKLEARAAASTGSDATTESAGEVGTGRALHSMIPGFVAEVRERLGEAELTEALEEAVAVQQAHVDTLLGHDLGLVQLLRPLDAVSTAFIAQLAARGEAVMRRSRKIQRRLVTFREGLATARLRLPLTAPNVVACVLYSAFDFGTQDYDPVCISKLLQSAVQAGEPFGLPNTPPSDLVSVLLSGDRELTESMILDPDRTLSERRSVKNLKRMGFSAKSRPVELAIERALDLGRQSRVSLTRASRTSFAQDNLPRTPATSRTQDGVGVVVGGGEAEETKGSDVDDAAAAFATPGFDREVFGETGSRGGDTSTPGARMLPDTPVLSIPGGGAVDNNDGNKVEDDDNEDEEDEDLQTKRRAEMEDPQQLQQVYFFDDDESDGAETTDSDGEDTDESDEDDEGGSSGDTSDSNNEKVDSKST